MAKTRSGGARKLSARVQREFGARLQNERRAKEQGQAEFGEQMELTRTSVSNLERGTQRVFLDQVYQAAYVLGVPLMSLLPSISDIFPQPAIHSAPDDPISPNTMAKVSRLIEDWTGKPVDATATRSSHEESVSTKRKPGSRTSARRRT